MITHRGIILEDDEIRRMTRCVIARALGGSGGSAEEVTAIERELGLYYSVRDEIGDLVDDLYDRMVAHVEAYLSGQHGA